MANTARHYEDIGNDLEAHLQQLSHEKSGLEVVVKRLQKENLTLQRENQLLKYTNGLPSVESKLLEIQEDRDRYKKDYQKLLEEFDNLKNQREKELATVLKLCAAFERKIEAIKAAQAET